MLAVFKDDARIAQIKICLNDVHNVLVRWQRVKHVCFSDEPLTIIPRRGNERLHDNFSSQDLIEQNRYVAETPTGKLLYEVIPLMHERSFHPCENPIS